MTLAMSTPDIQHPDVALQAPAVSVLTPVHNGERYLEIALESALAQTFQDFELIVVDDGSSDRSSEIGQRFARDHPRHIRYVRQDNAGLCAARNTGMALARGRYLALLDCDDIWQPTHLADSVAALDADPSLAMVHARTRDIDAEGRQVRPHGNRGWTRWGHDPFRAILLRHCHVVCPTAVFRRDLAQALGGFDMRYSYLGCEDRDMWLRLALRGGVRHLDIHGADYRVHPGGMSRNRERMLKARRLLIEHMRAYPQGARLHRAALAALALSEAEEYGCEGSRHKVARAYLHAICLRPTDIRGWRGLAATLVPRRRRGAGGMQ